MSRLFDAWLMTALLLGMMASATHVASDKNQQLIDAARIGDLENARALIEAGADVNAMDEHHWTALMYAAEYNHAESVRLLIEAGRMSMQEMILDEQS